MINVQPRAGRLRRKYKLDELPQLVNVLKREIQFVDPRSEAQRYVEMSPRNTPSCYNNHQD